MKLSELEGKLLEVAAHYSQDEWRQVLAQAFGPMSQGELWKPLPGPQTLAYESAASIVGYGGAAGGGKSDLAIGKALTQHRKSAIFRQEGTELLAVNERIEEVLGSRDCYNGSSRVWRFTRPDGAAAQIELGSFPNAGDEKKQRGRARDFMVFDEAQDMRYRAVRFVLGWLRTTTPGQHCQALLSFNPPNTMEGRWLIRYFAPWLDKKYPKRAKPGELRWFASIDGKDTEVESGAVFVHKGESIKPLSRTFIPSRVTDNPYLMGTEYWAQLQSLDEPFRSQMLYGDFEAGMIDDPLQVIPTEWLEAARARWQKPAKLPPMDAMGVDVARGGRDKTTIARRHDWWFDELLSYPGASTPDGPMTASLVVAARRDKAVVHIDVIGVGASPYDFLKEVVQVVPVNVGEGTSETDRTGAFGFKNVRSLLAWRAREAFDPKNNTGIAIPPDDELVADLASYRWIQRGKWIDVCSREEIIELIGRSPDKGSAFLLSMMRTPKRHTLEARSGAQRAFDSDPFADVVADVRRTKRGGRDRFERTDPLA